MNPLISINDDKRVVSCEIAINRALQTEGCHLETHVSCNGHRKYSTWEQWVEGKANCNIRRVEGGWLAV